MPSIGLSGMSGGGAVAALERSSGCFAASDAGYTRYQPGVNRPETFGTLFTDDFADYSKWTNVKNTWSVADGQAVSGGTGVCLARPTTLYVAKSVRVALKLTMPAASGTPYVAIPLRAVLGTGANADKFTGYEVVYNENGTLSFQIAINSSGQGQLQNASWDRDGDTDQHAMVIRLDGFHCRVWFSANSDWPDETLAPQLSVYDTAETYSRGGWVGMLTSGVADVKIDDLTVQEIVHIEARPPRVYSGRKTTVSLDGTGNLTAVSLVGPDGRTHALKSETGVVGASSASITFPDSFDGMEAPATGGYLLDASTADSRSVYPIEVRERPRVTLAFMTDTHCKKDGNAQTDNFAQAVWEVQNQIAWPRPNVLLHGGDIIEGDIWNDWSLQFAKAKEIMDTLTCPWYVIAGNHDTFWTGSEWADHGAKFIETFGAISHAFTLGAFLIIGTSFTALDGGYDDSDDEECLAFIEAAMDAYPSHKVILFGHEPWQDDTCDGSPHLSTDIRSDGSVHSLSMENAPDALALVESNSNVLCRFAGNAHVNGVGSQNDVWHFARASVKIDREWTYIELYSDRMVVHTVPMLTHYGDGRLLTWDDETDTLHTTDILYARGLPMERDYVLWFGDRTRDIGHDVLALGPERIGDATLTASVTLGTETRQGATWGGIIFRQQDPRNYYAALLCLDSQEVVLQKVVDGAVEELAREAVTGGLTVNVAASLVVELDGSDITVSVDATEEIAETDAAFATGTVGVKTSHGDVTVGPIGVT